MLPGLGLCPYKGLNYFDEADSDLFCRREGLTAKITDESFSLTSSGTPGQTRFLAVVGASGSGKSSLVRAGLVPSLRWNKASADWNILVLTPTAHPLESLAMNLTQESGSVAAAARLMDDLAHDPRSLQLFVKRENEIQEWPAIITCRRSVRGVFALCRSEEERASLSGTCLRLRLNGRSVSVVITLRADFYAYCANYIRLREALTRTRNISVR